MTAVLGGGLAGLSASYYSLQNPKVTSVVLLEASNRLGGWIQSQKFPSGVVFEKGPRTVRYAGAAGNHTLTLLDRLKLDDKIIPISTTHPAASSRMIYVKGKMVAIPTILPSLFQTIPPFSKSFFKMAISDLFTKSVKKDDESIHSFVERRFGREAADYLVSPVVAGIFAGDARQLSMKAFSARIFEAEQEYGSVTGGVIKKLWKERKKAEEESSVTMEAFGSTTAKKAMTDSWTMWTLRGGLEQLPQVLGEKVKTLGAKVHLNSLCENLNFKDSGVDVTVNGQTQHYKNIISALPAKTLAKLVKNQHPVLAEELEAIPAIDVGVVNLMFEGQVLKRRGFGFLVAPIEERPILGVIFDSGIDPSIKHYTTMTVMMGGAWYDKYFKHATKEELLSVAVSQVKQILQIDSDPVAHHVSILRQCIPQYMVGHTDRVKRIRRYISEKKLPLQLCGASYDAVGINDVIMSGKDAAESQL